MDNVINLSLDERKIYDELKAAIRSKCDLSNIARLGKTFKTPKSFYFYDTGTGKVLECEENEFQILEKMIADNSFDSILSVEMSSSEFIKALKVLKDFIYNENILQAPPLKTFYCAQNFFLEDAINNRLGMLTLEITERCNLRCDYCVYQNNNPKFRSYGKADMSFDIARKAIDYTVLHSKDSDHPFTVTFYGGEPLLRYDLIKQCISYAEKVAGNREQSYSFTSNLTLLTKEMADFFAKKGVSILVSLDGDKETHDAHRRYVDGSPTFEKTLSNLKMLVESYGNKAPDLISINSVITASSANAKSFDRIQDFWNSLAWFPKACAIQYSYVDAGLSTYENSKSILKGVETHDEARLNPVKLWRDKKADHSNFYEADLSKRLFSNSNTQTSFLHIHDRIITQMPSGHYQLNACCMPGSKRLYVTAKGKFKLCEKLGISPDIGDIDRGMDIEAIKKYYVEDYQEKSLPSCRNCWAINLCTVCYAQCFDENGVNLEAKEIECRVAREALLNYLMDYHTQLEAAPESLMQLNKIKVG